MKDEEALAHELNRRADTMVGAPLSFGQVRGRARQIRRRRRTTLSSGIAAVVLAVAIPISLGAGGNEQTYVPDPVAPPSAPTGPSAAVLQDGEITLPDGATVPVGVDSEDVSTYAVLPDGRIALALFEPRVVRVLAPDGTLQADYAVQVNDLTPSPTGDLVAWVGDDFSVQVLESGVPEPVALQGIPMPGESPGSIDAVLGSDCASGGCRVLGGDYSTTTVESTTEATDDLSTDVPLRITDVSPDESTWAVEFPPAENEQYGCVGLYDPEAGAVTAQTCDTSNLSFSPDGAHLLGARYENNMAGEARILDLDLETVGTYRPGPQVIGRAAWADATHVVASVAGLQDGRWSLVRIGLDAGDPEVLRGPVEGVIPEIGSEFRLSR